MTRRAAGRAGGRPGPSAAVVVPALLVLGTALLGGTPAQAAPAEDTAADGRPVQIVLTGLEPRTVVPGAPIELTGMLVNDSSQTYTDLSLRVQRGEALTSRQELAADLAEPSDAGTAVAPFAPMDDLEPGDSQRFSYTTTADVLELTADGVYPLLVNLNGTPDDGEPERVGELSTQLVVDQEPPATPTTVAWLWPVTDRPHRDATGAFTDDELADEVADGGRLDRAVEVLEQLPRTGGDPVQTEPTVPVTLAVDPALLEELSVMAAGPYSVGDDGGTGTADAADLLERLRTVAGVHPVVALAYADVDAQSLVTAGQAAAVLRSLPGTAEGTARQPGDGEGTPAPGTGAGAAIVRDVLGVEPRTDLAWPAGDSISQPTLDTLQSGGVDTVVLTDGALSDGGAAVGADGAPAVARSTLTAAAGDVTALVADRRLTEAVATATPGADGGRTSEQRYLAELGVLTTQLAADGDGAQQTVLVTPPRLVDPDPAAVVAMMTDTTTQPWLAAGSVESLADGPQTRTGDLTGLDEGLPAAGLAEIAESSRVREDFAAAVVGDPGTLLAGYDAAIARAGSAQWRADPDGFVDSATELRGGLAELRGGVTLLAPVDGTYSLASSDAPLVLTVQNDLPFAVQVRLEVTTRGNVGLTTDDIGVTTLPPAQRTTLQVPTHVRQSGGFAVTAQLTTPGDGALGAAMPLGEAVQMQVKSTAYGSITLGITIGAAALLGLLFLRRGVLFVLRRRRGEPTGADLAPDDAAVVPPTRSPV